MLLLHWLILFPYCLTYIIYCNFTVFQGIDSGNTMLSVGHVVTTSVSMCDIDMRPVRNYFLHFIY